MNYSREKLGSEESERELAPSKGKGSTLFMGTQRWGLVLFLIGQAKRERLKNGEGKNGASEVDGG